MANSLDTGTIPPPSPSSLPSTVTLASLPEHVLQITCLHLARSELSQACQSWRHFNAAADERVVWQVAAARDFPPSSLKVLRPGVAAAEALSMASTTSQREYANYRELCLDDNRRHAYRATVVELRWMWKFNSRHRFYTGVVTHLAHDAHQNHLCVYLHATTAATDLRDIRGCTIGVFREGSGDGILFADPSARIRPIQEKSVAFHCRRGKGREQKAILKFSAREISDHVNAGNGAGMVVRLIYSGDFNPHDDYEPVTLFEHNAATSPNEAPFDVAKLFEARSDNPPLLLTADEEETGVSYAVRFPYPALSGDSRPRSFPRERH